MRLIQKFAMLAISFAVLFTSCAKDGETGPQGPAGTNGTNGTNGTDGDVNVTTHTFTVNPNDWIPAGFAGQPGHCIYVEQYYSEITQNVYDNGTILGFVKDQGYWVAMPFTSYSGIVDVLYSSTYKPEFYKVNVFFSDLTTPYFTTSMEFKVVIVDGTLRTANPDLDWNNYYEVARRFDL